MTKYDEYVFDSNYVPEKIDDISFEYISNFCLHKGEDDFNWLCELANFTTEQTRRVKVKGESKKVEKKIYVRTSIPTIKKAFVKRYFPHMLDTGKDTKKTPDHIKYLEELRKRIAK